MDNGGELTRLLKCWSEGDRGALDVLMPLVYRELRNMADGLLRNERAGHTLQPTALIHEAYVRLVRQELPDFRNRSHFFGVAAQMMRQILVDYARRHRAGKRGKGVTRISLDEASQPGVQRDADLVDLDDALHRLASVDAQKSKLVELHYFGGMNAEEMAELMGISIRTIGRELRLAKAWLGCELAAPES